MPTLGEARVEVPQLLMKSHGPSEPFSGSIQGACAEREKGCFLEVASFPVQGAGCSLILKTVPSI